MAAGKNRISNMINSSQLNFFIPIYFQSTTTMPKSKSLYISQDFPFQLAMRRYSSLTASGAENIRPFPFFGLVVKPPQSRAPLAARSIQPVRAARANTSPFLTSQPRAKLYVYHSFSGWYGTLQSTILPALASKIFESYDPNSPLYLDAIIP